MLKNLQLITIRKEREEKSSYLISFYIFIIFNILFSWIIQFQFNALISEGALIFILIAILLITWVPVLFALLLLNFFKLSFKIFFLETIIGKKIFWSILFPSLIAAIGIKISLLLSLVSLTPYGSPLIINGDTFIGVLNLFFPSIFNASLFCIVISVGNEIIFRAFFIELCYRVKLKFPWFFAGLFQFIILLPFLWFGYFGGGRGNFKYIACCFFLFIFLSAFFYWLSLPSNGDQNVQGEKMQNTIANRTLVPPILAASIYQIIFSVYAVRMLSETDFLWMSGPANVITIMIFCIITIFLYISKRLKY